MEAMQQPTASAAYANNVMLNATGASMVYLMVCSRSRTRTNARQKAEGLCVRAAGGANDTIDTAQDQMARDSTCRCTRRICSRPVLSGRSTATRRSKRPGRSSAWSNTSGLGGNSMRARLETMFKTGLGHRCRHTGCPVRPNAMCAMTTGATFAASSQTPWIQAPH